MWDEKFIYHRIEMGYAYTEYMNDELIKKFNTGNFNEGSAILEIKNYNPKNLNFQHLTVKEQEKKMRLFVCEMVIL